MITPSSAPSSGTKTAPTQTRLEGRPLLSARLLWVVLVALTLGVFTIAIPLRLNILREVVATPPVTNFITGFFPQLTVEDEHALAELGLSIQFYAVYGIAIGVLFTLARVLLAILLVWRKSRDWLALFVSFGFVGSSVLFPPALHILFAFTEGTPTPRSAVQFVLALGGIATIVVWYVFPDGRFIPRWTRLSTGLIVAWVMFILVFQQLRPFLLPPLLQLLLIVILVATGVYSQLYRYFRVSTPIQRQQTKLLLYGIVLSFLAFPIGGLIGLFFPTIREPGLPKLLYTLVSAPIFTVVYLVSPIAIIIAILRYRLWEIDLTVNRSLVYGLVTFVLGIVFMISTVLLRRLFGGENTVGAFAIAAIGPTLLFNPTRKRAQHLIDRHFYGFRFDLIELNRAEHPPEIKNPGLHTGQTLGTYKLEGVLGKGGMGEVYKGYSDGKTVALKILPQILADDAAVRARFQREAQTLASLDHPNIVKMYEAGVADNVYYMVLEYVEGRTLSDIIKERGALPFDEVRLFISDVAAAIDYAHAQGLVHRDIKSSNVMVRNPPIQVTSDGQSRPQAVLMDFGVAKIQDAQTHLTGTNAVGTIDYMAPEQIMSAKAVDHHADIYALGIVLYEALTGERPFKGGAAQVMFAHIQQPAPDPRTLNSDIPSHVAHGILKALLKKPEDRFNSAGEFAASLLS